MKIGIFGGCFNPPHIMHYTVANTILEKGYLDKVIFVPTGDNYDKKDLATHENRVEMLKLMVDKVDMLVGNICKNGEYPYTYQVLDYYKEIYPEADIYFICGTDNLDWFKEWKNYEYMLKNYKLLVVSRNDDDIPKIMQNYKGYENSIEFATINPRVLSSTIIREYIKENEEEKLEGLINPKVLEYIKIKGLYKS